VVCACANTNLNILIRFACGGLMSVDPHQDIHFLLIFSIFRNGLSKLQTLNGFVTYLGAVDGPVFNHVDLHYFISATQYFGIKLGSSSF